MFKTLIGSVFLIISNINNTNIDDLIEISNQKQSLLQEKNTITVSFLDDGFKVSDNLDINLDDLENKEEIILNNIKKSKEDILKYKKIIKGIWPLEGYYEISSEYGNRINPITNEKKFHSGIDIPAPENTDILSIDDGEVIFSGVKNGYGNTVIIKHFDNKTSLYAHNNKNLVKEGDYIKKGYKVARVGSTGNSTGNHLHLEVYLDSEKIDPLKAIKK